MHMKKSYTKLVMLLLAMVGCMTASAEDNLVELDETMFKAWNSAGAVTAENQLAPENPEEDPNIYYDNHDGSSPAFGWEKNYFKNVSGGDVVYGSALVIWQWYADLTGTKKMYFYGEKGITIRVLYNRPEWYEGCSDTHGGTVNEKKVSIGDDGVGVLDVEALNLEYFHVNCLKIDWGANGQMFKKVMLEGSVQGSGIVYDPLEGMKAGFQRDVIALNLGGQTNLSQLLNGKERIMFPIESGSLKVNGEPVALMSVEGMVINGNARVLMFMEDDANAIDEEDYENAEVLVSFTNPEDPTKQLTFASGRFEGEAVPNITDMQAEHENGLESYLPNVASVPEVESADPELNSINLPVGMTEFKVKLTGKADISRLIAKFDGQDMTVSPSTGYADEITLTRAAGDVTPGVHTITLDDLYPEQEWNEDKGSATLKYSFGVINTVDGVKTYWTDKFEDVNNQYVPASWNITSDNELRTNGSYTGGCSVRKGTYFTETGVIYLCTRGRDVTNNGPAYAAYGENDEKLTLNADTTYHLVFDVTRWQDSQDRGVKVQVVTDVKTDEEGSIVGGGEVLAEQLVIVNTDNTPSNKPNHADIPFTVKETGNIVLKFFCCGTDGNPGGWGDNIALGNIKVQYIPDVMGIELIQTLNEAMGIAKTAKTAAEGERYAGDTYNALDALITKYTETPPTAPSSFEGAAKELTDAAKAMDDHRTLCENFDKLPAQLLTNIDKYAESKFNTQPAYTGLVETFNKYATIVEETVDVEGVETLQRTAKPNNITDDAALKAGIDEMTAANAKVAMFSEGASSNGTTGYAALHERLRRGVLTAGALGIAEDNAAVVAANEELGDNDAVANKLKAAIKKTLYAQLSENPTIDEPIDMTVYIKNPNIYVTKAANNDFSDAMAPGWHIEGENIQGNWGTSGGGGHVATDEIPADEALTISSVVTVTQQIKDLPAGVYRVTAFLGDRRGQDDFINNSGVKDDNLTTEENLAAAKEKVYPLEYLFINTSTTEEGVEFDNKTQVQSNGVSWGTTDANKIVSDEILVTDGKVTLGVRNDGAPAWFAFNEIRLEMVAPAPGFNYALTLGDVNGDGKITMADANAVVNYYLASDKDPEFPVAAADVNDDGIITMADANTIVNMFLAGE
jgi:hypothetical protein